MRPIAHFEDDTLVIPGLVTAHSHAFQHGLRGDTQRAGGETGSFWSWRDAMYRLAEGLTPERIGALSQRAFRELRRAGVVAVGEFHYVHHQADGTPYKDRTILADTVIRAALSEGLRITLLRVAYARAGAGRSPEGAQRRFCDPSPDAVLRDVETLRARWKNDARVRIGLAPHSVRAVPAEWLRPLHDHARAHHMPFHMHVAEVEGEVRDCLAEHGLRPVELLGREGVLDERFVAVHGTNLTHHEARLLGEAGASVCVCATTERDLGDGLADLQSLRDAGVRLCTGVDSHVITDPLEEMRALETHERLRQRRRVSFVAPEGRTPAEQLLLEGSAYGAQACGWDAPCEGAATGWSPSTLIDWNSPEFEGIDRSLALDALVFSGTLRCVRGAREPLSDSSRLDGQ